MPDPRQGEGLVVVDLREPETAVLLGDLHPERADSLQPIDHVVGDLCRGLDLERIDLPLQEVPQRLEEALALLDSLRVQTRLGMDQFGPEVPEEKLLAEARQFPFRLARRLGDLAGLFLRDFGGHGYSFVHVRFAYVYTRRWAWLSGC